MKFWKKHGKAKSAFQRWQSIVEGAKWKSLQDVRETFSSADGVKVKSGKTATVFNIGHNRAVVVIQYELELVNIRFVLTHDEYSKGKWKEKL